MATSVSLVSGLQPQDQAPRDSIAKNVLNSADALQLRTTIRGEVGLVLHLPAHDRLGL